MFFKQFYLGCLAQASYLIGDGGEAVVVDPRRDVEEYLAEASANGLAIRHVVETHLHADFVSGHREIAERTGAKIWIGAAASASFPHESASEGDEIAVGRVRLRFLETPGHTPESISLVVFDPADSPRPWGVLTGDALFIGDVGRPDLAAGGALTVRELAGMLYDSLHGKLLTLPDATRVFPAHGAGSLCGRNISKETTSTIGEQRRFNYALKPMSRDEFIAMMTVDLPEAPAYFREDARINREGPSLLSAMPEPKGLSPAEVEQRAASGTLVVDTREARDFAAAHVPGSLNIGLSGQFAAWAGSLIPPGSRVIVVAEDEDHVSESRLRLARVGLDSIEGHLAGGVRAWEESGRGVARTERISVDELADRIAEGRLDGLIDVRRPGEWSEGIIARARRVTLSSLAAEAANLPREKPLTVICAGGYRSSIAASVLERLGFASVTDVVGGMSAWSAARHPVAPAA